MSSSPETLVHVKHRETARALLLDPEGHLLLMLTHWDPGTGLPPRWLTPGGGIDPGETIESAGLRELFEETGLRLTTPQLGEVVGHIDFRMDWSEGRYETGRAHFFKITLQERPEISTAAWTRSEWRDIIDLRWWSVSEILNSSETFGPPGLVDLIKQHIS